MKYKIEDLHKIAKEKKGKCLSNEYIGTSKKYKWECSEGHQWESKLSNVIHLGRWCPECGGSKRLSIEDMHELAAKFGGKMLIKGLCK
jgi:hypothetical protein